MAWFIERSAATNGKYSAIYISGVPGMEEDDVERELKEINRLQAIEAENRELARRYVDMFDRCNQFFTRITELEAGKAELLRFVEDTIGTDNRFMQDWLKRYEAQRQIQNTERMTG